MLENVVQPVVLVDVSKSLQQWWVSLTFQEKKFT